MNSKQRILTALNNAQPDKVPIFEALIDEPIIIDLARLLGVDVQKPQAGPQTEKGMLQAEGSPEILDLYCLLVKELGLDATCYEHSIGLEDIGDGHGRDKYGVVYRLSGHGDPMVMEGPIKEPADIVGYDMASMLEPHDFAQVEYVIDRVGEEKAHFVAIMDPFKVSWLLRGGMENLLMDYVLNPGLVHGLARVATDFCMAAVDMAAGVGGGRHFVGRGPGG